LRRGDNKDDYQMSIICDYCDNGQCILNVWKHTQGKEDGVFPDIKQCNDFHYRLPVETDVQKKFIPFFANTQDTGSSYDKKIIERRKRRDREVSVLKEYRPV
jgi:hypothetical protein